MSETKLAPESEIKSAPPPETHVCAECGDSWVCDTPRWGRTPTTSTIVFCDCLQALQQENDVLTLQFFCNIECEDVGTMALMDEESDEDSEEDY